MKIIEYLGIVPWKQTKYLNQQRGPCCNEHAADCPPLVSSRLMQRRLSLLGVDHVERPLRRFCYQKSEDLLVPESCTVV